jgi:hypothetical protein
MKPALAYSSQKRKSDTREKALAITYLLLESWRVEISSDDERQTPSRHTFNRTMIWQKKAVVDRCCMILEVHNSSCIKEQSGGFRCSVGDS